MSRLFLIIGILLLLATEILRVYFIMPFPGSQQSNTIDWAYFIEKYKWLLRLIGLLLVARPAIPDIFAKEVIAHHPALPVRRIVRRDFLLFQFPVSGG